MAKDKRECEECGRPLLPPGQHYQDGTMQGDEDICPRCKHDPDSYDHGSSDSYDPYAFSGEVYHA